MRGRRVVFPFHWQGEDQGVVSEFVNPKFKDASRTAFTKPTRLECMMQDFPKLMVKELGPEARIGFTSLDKWLSFSPAKNSLEAGAKGVKAGTPAATVSTAEMEFYAANVQKLRAAGVEVGDPTVVTLSGIPLDLGARVVLSPSFAVTTEELGRKLGAGPVRLSSRSTLVVDGEDVCLESLDLDGTLVIRVGSAGLSGGSKGRGNMDNHRHTNLITNSNMSAADFSSCLKATLVLMWCVRTWQACPGARVTVRCAKVSNGGWNFVDLSQCEGPLREEDRIRGFKLLRDGGKVIEVGKPGTYVLVGSGELQEVAE
jgi:hypothetical protein